MATGSKKFQSPKGTRDFYPADMAVRRYIEKVWRETSINHGFEEVDGPTFEQLELYTHKSGPGIVSEIFGVFSGKDEEELSKIRGGADAPFALRPEFTPTLARMIAAKAAELPRPIKWFAIPSMFRAERPQRGRLREHFQWNVDFVGGEDDPAKADAETIACAVSALERFGLEPDRVRVRLSNRNAVAGILRAIGIREPDMARAFDLLDRRPKMDNLAFLREAESLGLDAKTIQHFDAIVGGPVDFDFGFQTMEGAVIVAEGDLDPIRDVYRALVATGVAQWCTLDFSIVRGLAYYTGTVFEIIAEGERAIAGGGRYDNLVESFGGPSLPACGFGMGDVVLANILHDKGLLPEELVMQPLRPHGFVIAATDEAAARLPSLVAQWRKAGLHIRHSYRSTRNVGKLLGEAGKARARFAVILGKELEEGRVAVKNLDSQDQDEVRLDEIPSRLSGQ